jgi:hypothetical protein
MVATRADGWEPLNHDQPISHIIPEIAIRTSHIIDFHVNTSYILSVGMASNFF